MKRTRDEEAETIKNKRAAAVQTQNKLSEAIRDRLQGGVESDEEGVCQPLVKYLKRYTRLSLTGRVADGTNNFDLAFQSGVLARQELMGALQTDVDNIITPILVELELSQF